MGPHLGAIGLDLLSVVGRNLIGRVQVGAGGAFSTLRRKSRIVSISHQYFLNHRKR